VIAQAETEFNQVWYLESSERFRFMLILALALHALLILTLNFGLPDAAQPAQTLEVTLARFDDKNAPDDADYLAQTNQQGSGEALEKHQPSTQERAIFDSEQPQLQSAMAAQIVSAPAELQPLETNNQESTDDVLNEAAKPLGLRDLLSTVNDSNSKTTNEQQKLAKNAPPPLAGTSTSVIARSMEIANLQAKLMLEQEKMAKRPKVTRVTSASTLAHEDADYLDTWRQRIETLGNLNYPEEARINSIHGSLRMLVSIRPDGSVHEVDILKSSGHPTLDDAAIRIVQLAAPFQPFPLEMRERMDLLEIIRTWKFEKGTHVY
jgi:protein TonB